mgnify:FL=1
MESKRYFASSIIVGCALLVSNAGCGDVEVFDLDPGTIDPHSIDPDHICFDGSEVELVRHSSACETISKSLAGIIHDGLVFSAEEMQTLVLPCEDGPGPSIDVLFDMVNHSILLDFSNVEQADRFREADFDGYRFDITLHESNGLLLSLTIDRELTTLPLDDSDVSFGRGHVEVNLAGVPYDQESLLALNLLFARIPPVESL